MSRVSAYKGTWEENKRPYIVLAPDAYVAVQGQTTVVTCGECNRSVDINKYLTGISTEATVDSPPGSATINLSIPDTDVNDLYVEGNFVIIPMMEIEIFAKGYYTVGGIPQYYRIFWGMVVSISKNWSNGVTTFSISCKDILHWWEKTNVILNPAFVGSEGASTNYQLFQNQFAGMNPYTIIIALAKEAMGDFSITDGSFMSFKPEAGPESQVIGQYAKDVMAYWQLKFGNIWNALVLYGTSGTAYTFEGAGMDISPIRFATSIFQNEADILVENKLTSEFKIQPPEIAAFKVDYTRAGDVQFFQNDTQSKLSVALTARDQIQYEFYCDTTGDIIFKPPFYNLNVIPNKPVSWINDFEIIDDGINDSEAEVVTHMTSSGNAFGGVNDYGLTDEITVPRTGVIDWHLLKRYGWRRQDFQCEWAGNPKKLFWFLLDMMDRINAKRHNGTVTIPMRPEIRMGFPVWIPHYDSFYYVNGVSHNYSPGGQATTTLQLVAKRSKFIAPKNLGRIKRVPAKPENKPSPNAKSSDKANNSQKADQQNSTINRKNFTYEVSFDGFVGDTAGLGAENQPNENPSNEPLIIRDPTTGKILGYPNVVMVYRTTFAGEPIAKQGKERGKAASHTKSTDPERPPQYKWGDVVRSLYTQLQNDKKAAVIQRIRMHRYEAGMSNAGLYDYAVDENGDFKEMVLIPVTSVLWGVGTGDPTQLSGAMVSNTASSGGKKGKASYPGGKKQPTQEPDAGEVKQNERNAKLNEQIDALNVKLRGKNDRGKKSDGGLLGRQTAKFKELDAAKKDLLSTIKKNHKGTQFNRLNPEDYNDDEKKKQAIVDALQEEYDAIAAEVKTVQGELLELNKRTRDFRIAKNLNVSVRPVSDEFGFEVIGHNRYGRGVYVDSGQTRLSFYGRETNELRIQYSATANLLTNPPSNVKVGLEADTSPEAFEKMQPEDWVTGASTHRANEVTLTSANTYASAINHDIEANAQIGAVFIEADATKRAKTIWELQPTLPVLDEVGFPACNCKLSKFEWYSILPKSVLQDILATQGIEYTNSDIYTLSDFAYVDSLTGQETQEATSSATRDPGSIFVSPEDIGKVTEERQNKLIAIYEKKDASGKVVGTIKEEVSSRETAPKQIEVSTTSTNEGSIPNTSNKIPDFFTALNDHLVKLFEESAKYNEDRELRDTGEDLNFEIDVSGPEAYIDPDSVLGPSGGSLFDRASLGDPDALEALQNQVNWDWTNSEKELENLNDTYNEVEPQLEKAWRDFQTGLVGAGTGVAGSAFTGGVTKVETVGGGPEFTGGGSTTKQPQPFTPAPLKLKFDKIVTSSDDAQETNPNGSQTSPTNSGAHSGDLDILPESPKANS